MSLYSSRSWHVSQQDFFASMFLVRNLCSYSAWKKLVLRATSGVILGFSCRRFYRLAARGGGKIDLWMYEKENGWVEDSGNTIVQYWTARMNCDFVLYLFIYLFIHFSFFHLFVYSLVQLFICLFIHSFLPFLHSFCYSFLFSLNLPFLYSVNLLIQSSFFPPPFSFCSYVLCNLSTTFNLLALLALVCVDSTRQRDFHS